MKKIIQTIGLVIVGIIAVYGINRFVTRPVVIEEEVLVADQAEKKAVKKETQTAEKVPTDLPEGSLDDWNLVLVGPDYPLEKDIPEKNLTEIPGSAMQLDRRVIASYEALGQAAEAAGFPLVIVSAYRSVSYQKQVFQESVNRYLAQGLSEKAATKETKKTSTEPGHSEHHTGLAIDIVDEHWQNNYPSMILEQGYGQEPGAKWLAEHARDYGFIVRYPKGKDDITKISYEPWHFRYVGVEHAQYIEEHNLTLEEYLDLLKEK